MKAIRVFLGLTVQGFAAAAGISVSYLRKIEAGKSNLRKKTAKKITDFAGIEVDDLFSPEIIKLKRPEDIPAVKNFYEENADNVQFFISRRNEDSTAHFLKTELVPDSYFKKKKRVVGEVVKDCRAEPYKKHFESKELSRELLRLVEKGVLAHEDVTGKKGKYWYFEP